MKPHRLYPQLLLAVVLSACATHEAIAPPPAHSTPDITAGELHDHIYWLASDELEGRGTGTEGNARASAYIAREFERYGLRPAGTDGYFQPFEVITDVALDGTNRVVARVDANAGGRRPAAAFAFDAVAGTDFLPYGFSKSDHVQGDVVFAGFGITAPEQDHDDYAHISVAGKIALVLGGAPDEDNPHASLAAFASARSKALFAREAGAAAVLIVHPDKDELPKLAYDNAASGAGIVVLAVSRRLADTLLVPAGVTAEEFSERLDTVRAGFHEALPTVHVSVEAGVRYVRATTRNVIGELPGTDPSVSSRIIVIGGHFDHLGWGQDGTLYKGKTPMIHNGADDNASGTAGVLELAQYYAAHPPKHTMLFMGFAAEEMGLLGSAHWTSTPTRPLSEVLAMVNFDMIGRLADSTNKLDVQGIGTSPVWEKWVKDENTDYHFDLALIPDGQGASDHSSFYLKDIPVLFFFTGLHSDYHRPTDDADRINFAGEEHVLKYARKVIDRIDAQTGTIAFTKVKQKGERVRGFNVYVGTIPDYGYQGEGFKLSGTSPGGPAEKAGLKGEDIMIRFGDMEIKNIYDYMNALGLHKAGEEVPVVVKRGNGTVTLTVKLEKR